MIHVWPDIYARAWPGHEDGTESTPWVAGEALTTKWSTDARFSGYTSSSRRRLDTDAEGRVDITMRWLVVDIDAPKDADLRKWRASFGGLRLPGKPFAYWTRAGLRVMWRTDMPIDNWSRVYTRALLALYTRHGLRCDPQCRDWTRLFRLPHTVRDGTLQNHGYLCGSPNAIGEWPGLTCSESQARDAMICLAVSTPGWSALALADLERDKPKPEVLENVTYLAEHAIRWAERAVRESSAGERNLSLFKAAAWLASKPNVPRDAACSALADVAREVGLEHREIVATLKSAYRKAAS